ncbi:MAG: UDP-N-acetylmuramate dehydrogenase [Nitriliruptorales bacterium]|nr:UDP-N-acetylmuramate dehydrogenase [Nitriliruptorales bacterium]
MAAVPETRTGLSVATPGGSASAATGGDDELVARLTAAVGGEVRAGERLAAHTTLKVGGPAAALLRAEHPSDLVAVAEVCAELRRPWLILGRGSNLLVADAGWPGAVVTLGRGFRGWVAEGSDVVAGAAEPMPVLSAAVARQRLAGLAFGVAIPGSLGGAVRMNAGAMGREMRDVLDSAEVVRLGDGGRLQRLDAAELRMTYRHTALPADAVVVRARLRLRPGAGDELAAEMAAFKQWRREHQPINEPSCGSVFRNPPGDSAGRLIDSSGLKGHRVGGAQVSDKHANFITVRAGATAGDVAQVITDVRRIVAERHGVTLVTEVVLAGFAGEPGVQDST